ncbi:hypothetical protein JZU56_04000, partial [bacterium]|nr:hypothetical protein [bacterium]
VKPGVRMASLPFCRHLARWCPALIMQRPLLRRPFPQLFIRPAWLFLIPRQNFCFSLMGLIALSTSLQPVRFL